MTGSESSFVSWMLCSRFSIIYRFRINVYLNPYVPLVFTAVDGRYLPYAASSWDVTFVDFWLVVKTSYINWVTSSSILLLRWLERRRIEHTSFFWCRISCSSYDLDGFKVAPKDFRFSQVLLDFKVEPKDFRRGCYFYLKLCFEPLALNPRAWMNEFWRSAEAFVDYGHSRYGDLSVWSALTGLHRLGDFI